MISFILLKSGNRLSRETLFKATKNTEHMVTAQFSKKKIIRVFVWHKIAEARKI